jgi:class 3 adenylate cyclase
MNPPQHIFVVDDEASAREMVSDYLQLHGFKVTVFDGGASLRAGVNTATPDLIVLDLSMPEEDGLSIIRFLKQISSIPIIMLTATANTIDKVVGLELGADDYVAKPCELRELVARIRAVLRRQKWSHSRQSERRLAAIVSIDIFGFSRLVQLDESGTLAAVDAVFGEFISPSVVQRNGTIFKMLGDGALVEFPSVLDAVEWAVGFQRAMLRATRTVLEVGQLKFRLGVAVGDIIVGHSDRFGESIALAVRIQEISTPGSVFLSDYTHQFVRGKTSIAFRDGGSHSLKNIAEPMRVWIWSGDEPNGG